MMKPLNPMMSYFGSKWRLVRSGKYPRPLHPLIIEPFAGGAGYALNHHWKQVVLVDANPTITDVWSFIRGSAPEIIQALPDRVDVVPGHLEPGAQALIGFWLAHAISAPRTRATPWVSKHPQALWWGPAIKQRIIQQAPFIRHWQICSGSYRSLPNVEATWFIDPPYQHGAGYYAFSDIDYAELADWVRSRRGQVIVCEGGNADWLPFQELAPGRKKANRASGQMGLAEKLWYREGT